MMKKTKTVHTTSKRTGYVVVCAPAEEIKAVRFDDSQVARYSLCSEKGGRTATIFPSRAQADKAARALFESNGEIGWITVLAVGPLETSRVKA